MGKAKLSEFVRLRFTPAQRTRLNLAADVSDQTLSDVARKGAMLVADNILDEHRQQREAGDDDSR